MTANQVLVRYMYMDILRKIVRQLLYNRIDSYSWRSNHSDNNGRRLHGRSIYERHMESGLIPVQVTTSSSFGFPS